MLRFIMELCLLDWDVDCVTNEINFIAFSTSVIASIVRGYFYRDLCSPLTKPQTASFAIQDLVLHPEYITPLRHEMEGIGDIQSTEIEELPILDSVIKESMRTNCFEASKPSLFLCPFPVQRTVGKIL